MKQIGLIIFFICLMSFPYCSCAQSENSMTSTAQNFMDLFNFLLSPTTPVPKSGPSKAQSKLQPKKQNNTKKITKKKKKQTKKKIQLDPTKIFKAGWMKISSKSFKNSYKFPPLKIRNVGVHRILTDHLNFRLNDRYHSSSKNIPDPRSFWFRLSGRLLYYSNKQDDINVLDTLYIKNIKSVLSLSHYKKNANCFKIKDVRKQQFKLCLKSLEEKIKWVCKIQEMLGHRLEKVCKKSNNKQKKEKDKKKEKNKDKKLNLESIVTQKITQPLIIIPQPSPNCNEKWDYADYGKSWQCTCTEGKEQSPIDLPKTDQAIHSAVKPHFSYEVVKPVPKKVSSGSFNINKKALRIQYHKNALRIKHKNLGKAVTLDGAVYIAEEIVFHTPSEHTINGERFDMEMQVIHRGKSKGDIAKQVMLSVMFKARPGIYNKFLEKLDFFNLPNQNDKYREIKHPLFIPFVFLESDAPDIYSLNPFSFYTYQGSLTQPPCSERTIVYVAANPAPIGMMGLSLFKEALRKKDTENQLEISSFGGDVTNYRSLQPLNGRAIFYYDHIKFCGPNDLFNNKIVNNSLKKKKIEGHYEKHEITSKRYFYVDSEKPSGMPGAFLVSKNEAGYLGFPF